MAYIHRSLERKFLKMSSAFKAVMVTGARQVGKSTMLKYLAQDTGRSPCFHLETEGDLTFPAVGHEPQCSCQGFHSHTSE